MDINIFLASSAELKDDRNKFQLFINQLNEDWCHRDVCFHLNMWEDSIDSMSKDGLQARYNEVVANSDIFLMLFFTKVGPYTAEEFEIAFKQFGNKNKPRIYTYFKEDFILTGQIGEEIITMLEFKKKLATLKHYVSTYTSIEDLKWKFNRQLEKIYGDKFSDNYDINSITSQAQIDSMAIERVCRLLSPNAEENIIDNLKLPALVSRASDFAKTAIFQLAKVNRRSNRTNNRKLMARSIPVFEALVNSNVRRDQHRYFGQLAYALKDQEKSEWKKAEENFDIAIDIRSNYEVEYFYEFNRAICKVQNDINASKDLILQDLVYAKKGIGKQFEELFQEFDNRILQSWLLRNNIKFQDF